MAGSVDLWLGWLMLVAPRLIPLRSGPTSTAGQGHYAAAPQLIFTPNPTGTRRVFRGSSLDPPVVVGALGQAGDGGLCYLDGRFGLGAGTW
jgi:hypothetical protein